MFKKSLATALLICSIPAMASASWFLTTQVKSAGGTLSSLNGDQVVTDGIVTKSYTATADQTPTTALDAGYTQRYLSISDTDTAGLTTAVTGSTFTPADGHTYTVTAAFKVNSLAVSAVNNGGSVTPTKLGNIYYGYKLPAPLTFTFSPSTGGAIKDITGLPLNAVADGVTMAVPGGVNQRATVTFPKDYVFTSAFSLQAVTENLTPAINQIAPQTVVAGGAVSVTASVVNIPAPSYTWTYVSGPDNSVSYRNVNGKVYTDVTPGPVLTNLAGTASNKITFTAPSKPGQYKFQVQVGTLVKLVVVNVVATAADATGQCQFCHTANKIDDLTIGTRYQASIHGQSTHSSCQACHFGTGTAGHPGSVSAKTVSASTFSSTVDNVVGANGTTMAKGAVFCATCHTGNYPIPHPVDAVPPSPAAGLGTTCVACHTAGSGDAHDIQGLAVKLTPAVGDACILCHDNRNTSFKSSVHFNANGQNTKHECMFCHGYDGTTKSTAHGNAPSCDACHPAGLNQAFDDEGLKGAASACAGCHAGGGHPHSIKTVAAAGLKKECLDCHSAPVTHIGGFATNIGVRAVASEFTKKSHHIFNPVLADGTTVDPAGIQSKHCVVCHMEGTNDGTGKVAVDSNFHVKGAVSLRNVDTNTVIKWNGGTGVNYGGNKQAEYTAMDNFCMACHDDNGASNISNILALNPVATALNPFGDSISNDYDQVKRSRVVNVFSQFSTGNSSHHAVRGQKYKARTTAQAVAAGKMVNSDPTSDKLADKSVPVGGETGQNTLYSGGLFTSYIPQGDTLTVADNSTLHCGDCHTVGQLNYGENPANGTGLNKVAIGAHGSVNAYMLRNNNGDDALHTRASYVCYNCHNNLANGYMNVPGVTGTNTMAVGFYNQGTSATNIKPSHAGVPSNCQIDVSTAIGGARLTAGSGNVTGISCTQCHNSGRTGFGGIHGGNGYYTSTWVAYTSAAKTKSIASNNGGTAVLAVTPTQVEHRRFMGGMGNYGYKPAGGSWEWNGKGDMVDPGGANTGGCYTNQTAGDNAGWSSCIHHSTANGTSGYAAPARRSSMGNVGRPLDY